ncbi:hypothetical protein G6F60_015601 [Rhizopus arrhizus]|nr:hypothetical protein G6F60_015601 [Rhizopus arrhizus]
MRSSAGCCPFALARAGRRARTSSCIGCTAGSTSVPPIPALESPAATRSSKASIRSPVTVNMRPLRRASRMSSASGRAQAYVLLYSPGS